jgi:hypothetical protein
LFLGIWSVSYRHPSEWSLAPRNHVGGRSNVVRRYPASGDFHIRQCVHRAYYIVTTAWRSVSDRCLVFCVFKDSPIGISRGGVFSGLPRWAAPRLRGGQ